MDKKKQLLVAVTIFVVAIFITKAYIDGRISEATPKESVKIVVAKKNIAEGTPLSEGLMKVVTVPKNFAPKTAITQEERKLFEQQQVGVNILEGDYILQTMFTSRGAVGRTLAKQIGDPDFRAVTIPVDETNSFARSIVAGDNVDITFTFSTPYLKQKVATMLLQNALVISTGAYSAAAQELGEKGSRGGKYNTITLKLTAQDAVRLNYARQVGQINLLLRSEGDNKNFESPVITGFQDVLSASDKATLETVIKSSQENYQIGSERIADQIRENARAAIEQGRRQAQGVK